MVRVPSNDNLYRYLLAALGVWLAVLLWIVPPLLNTCDDHADTPKDVCFVTSIFGDSVDQVDQPAKSALVFLGAL